MPREVPEWIGKTADSRIPDRVRIRVFDRDNRTCQCGCGMTIRPGDKWETDHTIALINWKATAEAPHGNRESNLRTLLAGAGHHGDKSKADVAEKSKVYRVKKRHYGLKKPKGRPLPGTRASGIRKRMDGTVERW